MKKFYTIVLGLFLLAGSGEARHESYRKNSPREILASITTNSSGSWNSSGVWNPATVPGSSDNATVNHSLILNTNLNVGGIYTFNAAVTDNTGNTAYTLDINGSGILNVNAPSVIEGSGSFSNSGRLNVNKDFTIKGFVNASNNSVIYVKSGATLTLGGANFSNNMEITVEAGGYLVINGDFQANNNVPMNIDGTMTVNGNFNSNNNADISVNGALQVNGNYTSTGNAAITGTGTVNTTGTLIMYNQSTTFGSSNSCTSGPCNGSELCSHTNTISTLTPTICSGNAVSFTGTTTATTPVYLWQYSTTSATSGFVTVSGTSNAATYTSGALNQTTWFKRSVIKSGCTKTAVVQVTVNPSPVISTQPTNASICAGANASFTVAGTNVTSYAWQINNSGTWTALTNTTPYSGVATATLALTAPSSALNGKQYRCVWTNSCGKATSSTVTLSISSAPSITGQPANATACTNGSATFTVTATGTTLAYKWQINNSGTWADLSASSPYSNVTTATLSITNPAASLNSKQYRCLVSGACTPTVTSNTVTLTVNSAVSITTQPVNATACGGGNASFTVTAAGSGLTYAWETYNGTTWSNVTNTAPHSGVTTATLTLTAPSSTYNGKQYRCKVTGTCTPSVTSDAVTLSTFNSGEWKGGTGDWSTAANWCGGVPTSTTDLVINSGTVVLNNSGSVRNVTISAGGTLRIAQPNTLSVYGNWSNNGTFTADSVSTVQFTGSAAQAISGPNTFRNLTINNSNGVTITSGTANKETVYGIITLTSGVFTTNNNLIMDFDRGAAIAGTGTGSFGTNLASNKIIGKRYIKAGWHYLGASFDNMTYGEFSDNLSLAKFYTYQESNPNPNMNYGWVKRGEATTTSLTGQKDAGGPSALVGYCLQLATGTTLDFTGNYEGKTSYTTGKISYTNTGNITQDGWHLISNPYPSYIDWNSANIVKDGIANTIYYYDYTLGTNLAYIGGDYSESINGATQYLPPLQGIWIQTTKSNAELIVPKSAISIPAVRSTYFRKGAGVSEFPSVKLSASGTSCADETVLRFIDEATEELDQDKDVLKFKNEGACPSLYTVDHATEYAINSLPELHLDQKHALNFEAYTHGTYSISIKEMKNIPEGVSVILEDKHTHQVHNFSMEPVYEFTASTTDNAARFELYFEQDKLTSTIENFNEPDIDIVSYNHHVNVHFHHHTTNYADVSVFDMAGHMIYKNHHADISSNVIDFKLHHVHTGVFVVQVATGEKTHTEKIHLH